MHKTLTPECLEGYEGTFQALLGDPMTRFSLETTLGGRRLVRSGHSGLYYEVHRPAQAEELRRELRSRRKPEKPETLEELLS